MAYHSACSVFLVLVCVVKFCVGQYAIPEVKFEAFSPKGLRISIPAEKGVELFAFHGKLNKPINQIEPGEFNEDIKSPSNGRFTYINPSVRLKEGDAINYWVFVQHDQLGFKKDNQSWTVDKLLPQKNLDTAPQDTCPRSTTKVLGKGSVCSGDDVINYRFTESTPNAQVWLVDQFIPTDPDWEYVIYKNEPDVIGIENNALRIRPKVDEGHLREDINIDGCTHQGIAEECERKFQGIVQNPIVSGRIVSKTAFCFGNITIRAKLPRGDWLYPELYLEDINNPTKKIWLAYARGNEILLGNNNEDIGGKLLFGGPMNSKREPERSMYLTSYRSQNHIGSDWHTFTVRWTKDQIVFYMDDINYGTVNADSLQKTEFNKENMVRLVLGVGAAGLTNFPDGYRSGENDKPWKNTARTAVRDFFGKKGEWQKTWNSDNQLLVEYVTVKAL